MFQEWAKKLFFRLNIYHNVENDAFIKNQK